MEIDRLAPCRRDSCPKRATGRQAWRELLFVHYEVPVATLRALVPEPLAIDTYEGRAFVGLVPFTMDDVRFGPIPVARFLETNLRTYVHAPSSRGAVPGVWFFSLDAASALAVLGGRALFGLPYFRARMEHDARSHRSDYRLERVQSARNAELDVRWIVHDEPPHHAAPDTLEHFLTERYALYGPTRRGSVYRVRVHHAPWPLRRARVDRLATSLLDAAGVTGARDPIDLVLASPDGVAVETFAKEPIHD